MSLGCDLHKLFSSGMALLGLLSLAVASISLKSRLVLTFFFPPKWRQNGLRDYVRRNAITADGIKI